MNDFLIHQRQFLPGKLIKTDALVVIHGQHRPFQQGREDAFYALEKQRVVLAQKRPRCGQRFIILFRRTAIERQIDAVDGILEHRVRQRSKTETRPFFSELDNRINCANRSHHSLSPSASP